MKNKNEVLSELEHLKEHFYSYNGIHYISEIFNWADSKEGKGCIHQAWSVADFIKLYIDYGLDKIEKKMAVELEQSFNKK